MTLKQYLEKREEALIEMVNSEYASQYPQEEYDAILEEIAMVQAFLLALK